MRLARMAAFWAGLANVALAQQGVLPPDRLGKVRGVLDAIYSLEYETAKARSREMISQWPDDPAGYVCLARVLWQELLFEERALTLDRFTQSDFFSETPRYKATMDQAAEQRFRAASDEAIRRARVFARNRPKDPAALYLLGAAYQNEASFQISLNNAWFAAIRAGNKSYRAHRDLLAVDPNCEDARLVTGIYNYTVGSLPWSVKWLALLFGYQGSRERGTEELEAAAVRGEIVADDARAILVVLYAREKRYDLAVRKLQELRARYPRNYLTHLDMAGLEIRRGNPSAAVVLYKEALASIESGEGTRARIEKAIVHVQLGIAYRAMKNFSEAETWLRRALQGDSSTRSRALAHLELGKTLDLAGRREAALEQYRLAGQAPDYAGSRRLAAEYLDRPYHENR